MAVFREAKEKPTHSLLLVLVVMVVPVVALDMVIKTEVILIQCIIQLVVLMAGMAHQQTLLIMLARARRVQDKVQQLVCSVKLMANYLLQVDMAEGMGGLQVL